jgi:predicted nuclease with RNAse H fold
MLFNDSLFIGIDPTSARKAFTYAALDRGMNLIALADGELEDVLSFLAGQKSAVVAINAPIGVNHGLVRERIKQEMLTPHQIRGAEFRLAEYELRQRGIIISGTPGRSELCPAWVQSGFELYRKLKTMGFEYYPVAGATHQMLETHPHACFCVLTGHIPLPKPTLEGRLQRQLILYEHGLRIKDPMNFFEEITRFKLLKGSLPVELISLPEQLDALVAAFTAWKVGEKPGEITQIGDDVEGRITLPLPALKEKY